MLGILGFVSSLFAAVKAFKIDRKLIKYKQNELFKQNEKAIILRLQGFVEVISNDDFSKNLIPDIVANLSNIENTYKDILPIGVIIRIRLMIRYLKKPFHKIKTEKISYELALLKGILKNGDFQS